MLAICPNCSLIFPSAAITLGSGPWAGQHLVIADCEEACPRCGAFAKIIDTIVHDGVIELVGAPWATSANIQRLAKIVEQLQRGALTTDAAEKQAARIDPDAGKNLREWLNLGVNFTNTLLLAAGLYLGSCSHDHGISSDDLKAAVATAVEVTLREQMKPAAYPNVPPQNQGFPQTQPRQENRKERRARDATERAKKRPHR
jgi:hypothetical protein